MKKQSISQRAKLLNLRRAHAKALQESAEELLRQKDWYEAEIIDLKKEHQDRITTIVEFDKALTACRKNVSALIEENERIRMDKERLRRESGHTRVEPTKLSETKLKWWQRLASCWIR